MAKQWVRDSPGGRPVCSSGFSRAFFRLRQPSKKPRVNAELRTIARLFCQAPQAVATRESLVAFKCDNELHIDPSDMLNSPVYRASRATLAAGHACCHANQDAPRFQELPEWGTDTQRTLSGTSPGHCVCYLRFRDRTSRMAARMSAVLALVFIPGTSNGDPSDR